MPSPLTAIEDNKDLRTMVDEYERRLILSALAASGGQKNRAAVLLGVLATTLHEKIKRLGIANPAAEAAPAGAQTVTLGDRAQEFRWRGHLRRGSVLEIKGMTGGVRACVADGEEVEVIAVRSGHTALGQVAVSVLEHDKGAMFSVYETRPGVSRPGAASNKLRVDFQVKVPEGVSLVARILAGNIEVQGLTGEVEAYTMSGQVKLVAPRPIQTIESAPALSIRSAGVPVRPGGEGAALGLYQPQL